MLELRTAGKLKTSTFVFAFQTKFQRRLRIRDLSDLAEIFKPAICTSHRRTAIRANEYERRSRLKFDPCRASRAVCLKNAHR